MNDRGDGLGGCRGIIIAVTASLIAVLIGAVVVYVIANGWPLP